MTRQAGKSCLIQQRLYNISDFSEVAQLNAKFVKAVSVTDTYCQKAAAVLYLSLSPAVNV